MTKQKEKDLMEELRKGFIERMEGLGYHDITDFWRRSGIETSHETVRRALHGGKPVSIESVIKIAAHLDYSPKEIAEITKALGDDFWHRIIDSESAVSESDIRLVDKLHRIFNAKPSLRAKFTSDVELLAEVAGVTEEGENHATAR